MGSRATLRGNTSVCAQLFASLLVNKGEDATYSGSLFIPLRLFLATGHVKVHTSVRPQWAAAAFDIMIRDKPRSSIRVISSFNPPENTCSPLTPGQQRPARQKYTTQGTWVWYALVLRDCVMAPGGSPARPGLVSRSHASLKSSFKANHHLGFYPPVFILTRSCDQSNGF